MRRSLFNVCIAVLCALVMSGVGAHAVATGLDREKWRLLGVPGEAESRFRWLESGALEVVSDGSVGFFYREVMPNAGGLAWRWRVDRAGADSDLRAPGADDRPVAVHLWFPQDGDAGSLFGWAASLFGYPPVGRALTYVWGGTEPRGTAFANPHLEEGRGVIVILREAASAHGNWMEEQIDYAADFERHFGRPAPPPSHIAISGDSDDLGGMRAARIDRLRFVETAPEK